MPFITAADGRVYEVVEGALAQDAPYVLRWQDLADEIAEEEASGTGRCCAVTAVLTRHGRNSVFVRRLANTVDPSPSAGTERVYSWNLDGEGKPAPGQLVTALERPARTYYEAAQAAASAASVTLGALVDDITLRIKQGRGARAAATTDPEGQTLLVAFGLVAEDDAELAEFDLASAKQMLTNAGIGLIAQRRDALAQLPQQLAAATRAEQNVAAVDALGGGDWSVYEIEAKRAELFPEV